MSQLSLFGREHDVSPPRAPDTAFIRKSLNRVLRTLRDAVIMPWSYDEAESWERRFPELAAYLPSMEAEALTGEFNAEIERLRLADR